MTTFFIKANDYDYDTMDAPSTEAFRERLANIQPDYLHNLISVQSRSSSLVTLARPPVSFSLGLQITNRSLHSFRVHVKLFYRIVSFSPARSRAPALSVTRCVNTSIGLQCINTNTDTEVHPRSSVLMSIESSYATSY